jgi:4-hydroxybenzoate polyprenyltransferase
VAYSLWLKRVPVVDLFCVAGGFVLRVFAGAVAIEVVLS